MKEGATIEEKDFDLRLRGESDLVRGKYHELYLKRRLSLANENGGRPVEISMEDKKSILKRARVAAFHPNIDLDQMERDWEAARTSEGRPPIGAANDD